MAIERGASQDIQDVVMAMAHRGRLNVLANIMRKSPQRIFREFADLDPELHVGRGDVKYHLGHSTDYVAENGRKVHLTLCFNPSHLEYVNPVAIGRMLLPRSIKRSSSAAWDGDLDSWRCCFCW